MTVPTNVLAIPGDRSILVVWDKDPLIAFFNVYMSVDGGELDIAAYRVFDSYSFIRSIPVRRSINIKVNGVLAANGQNTPTVDAKLGELLSDTVRVKLTAVAGSTIKAGTLVTLRASDSYAGGQALIRFPNEVNF